MMKCRLQLYQKFHGYFIKLRRGVGLRVTRKGGTRVFSPCDVTQPLPTHTVINLHSWKRLLLSEMVPSLFKGPSKPSAAQLNPQQRLPHLLYLIPFSLIAGALQEGVTGRALMFLFPECLLQHPLRLSSGESCILYYFHAFVASSQLTLFFSK